MQRIILLFSCTLNLSITIDFKIFYSSLSQTAKMKLFIAAALFTLGLAAPVTVTTSHGIAARDAFTCPGGLTNSNPMCCAVNVIDVLALDCKTRTTSFCLY
jgi:hypothetical protein